MLKKGLPKEDGKVMFLIFTMLAKITWKREEVWNIFNDILCFVALPRCLPFCDIYTTIYVLLQTLLYLFGYYLIKKKCIFKYTIIHHHMHNHAADVRHLAEHVGTG